MQNFLRWDEIRQESCTGCAEPDRLTRDVCLEGETGLNGKAIGSVNRCVLLYTAVAILVSWHWCQFGVHGTQIGRSQAFQVIFSRRHKDLHNSLFC